MSADYPAAEAFLAEAVQPDFAARALARIAEQTEAWDHSYEWCGVAGLVRGLAKQTQDVAGYAAILAARSGGVDATSGARARGLLAAIAQRGAEAHLLVAELARLLESTQFPPAGDS